MTFVYNVIVFPWLACEPKDACEDYTSIEFLLTTTLIEKALDVVNNYIKDYNKEKYIIKKEKENDDIVYYISQNHFESMNEINGRVIIIKKCKIDDE